MECQGSYQSWELEPELGVKTRRPTRKHTASQGQKLLPFPRQGDSRLGLALKGWSRWGLLPVASGDWLPQSAWLGPGCCFGLAAGGAGSRDDLCWSLCWGGLGLGFWTDLITLTISNTLLQIPILVSFFQTAEPQILWICSHLSNSSAS